MSNATWGTKLSEDANDDKGWQRFVRWQQITREHLSYSINLILGFAAGAIGFEISISLNDQFAPTSWERPVYLLSLVFLTLSVGFGLGATVSRLRDFRKTTRITKLRWKGDADSHAEISLLKTEADRLGNLSWCFFYLQVASFGMAVLLAALVFFFVISARFS